MTNPDEEVDAYVMTPHPNPGYDAMITIDPDDCVEGLSEVFGRLEQGEEMTITIECKRLKRSEIPGPPE